MNDISAEMRLYERASPVEPWRAAASPEPALLGKAGMGWSHFFRRYARANEPIKVEGDKRAPAGIYRIGRSFGILPPSRPDYLHVTSDTVCVNEPSSPQYNAITSRKLIGPSVSAENMSRALPMYRRGLVVDYPTDGKAQAGSCIFIHVWRSPSTGTAGCVSMPEPKVEALQEFASGGAVIAILPQAALGRFANCLPKAGETASVPNPKFARLLSENLRELRVQKGHWNHRVSSVALVRKLASEQAENSGELPNRDTSR